MKQAGVRSTKPKSKKLPGKVDQLVELLEQMLCEGRFVPGDRFFSTYEIAREYGVSPGTARKAMGELVDRRYLEASQRSGYFLRQEGGRLAARKSRPSTPATTALLVIANPPLKWGKRVLDEYVAALEKACERYEWHVVKVVNKAEEIEQAVEGKRLAGCVAYGLNEPPAVGIDLSSTICWASTGDWREPLCSIMSMDAETASRLAHEHLWDLGHQRTALVRPQAWQTSTRSLLGMRKAYAAMGHSWSPDDVILVSPERVPGLYEQICSAGITGILCEDWALAVELYRQAHRLGEQIGDRLSIVTIGGHDMADILQPPPARARWRAIDFAYIIVQALLRREEGKPMPRQLVVPVFLEEGRGARPPRRGQP